MEITVKRTGGFGAPSTDESWGPVDTAQAGDVGQQLEGLVNQVGFFDLNAEYPPGGPDQFDYAVEVVDGDRQHTVSYAELNEDVPNEIKEITKLVIDQSGS